MRRQKKRMRRHKSGLFQVQMIFFSIQSALVCFDACVYTVKETKRLCESRQRELINMKAMRAYAYICHSSCHKWTRMVCITDKEKKNLQSSIKTDENALATKRQQRTTLRWTDFVFSFFLFSFSTRFCLCISRTIMCVTVLNCQSCCRRLRCLRRLRRRICRHRVRRSNQIHG